MLISNNKDMSNINWLSLEQTVEARESCLFTPVI